MITKDKLHRLLTRRSVTCRALVEQMGICQSTFNRKERMGMKFYYDELDAIRKALRMTGEEFGKAFFGDDNNES